MSAEGSCELDRRNIENSVGMRSDWAKKEILSFSGGIFQWILADFKWDFQWFSVDF